MKNTLKFLFVLVLTASFPTLAMSAEEDSYIEDESSTEYVETSDNEQMENLKSKTESSKYQYDIEIYRYVNIKYTSVKTKTEKFDKPNSY